MNQTRPHCVNQMGKTHSKPLAARHVRGTAWARHAMCESAFRAWTGETAAKYSIAKIYNTASLLEISSFCAYYYYYYYYVKFWNNYEIREKPTFLTKRVSTTELIPPGRYTPWRHTGRVEVWLHSFFVFAQDGVEGLPSLPGRFVPGKNPGTHWIEGLVDPRHGMDVLQKRKISYPVGFEPWRV
jgi:hypothetical protein